MGVIRSIVASLRGKPRRQPGRLEQELLSNDWSSLETKATFAEGISRSIDGRPVFNPWDMGRAVREGVKSTVWVYACVQKIASSVASVPVIVMDSNTDEPLPSHPLQILLEEPNAFWSRQDFFERLAQHLLLSGNGYVAKNGVQIGSQTVVAELWLLPPDQMAPVPDRETYISHYVRRVDGQEKTIPAEEIAQLMLSDPSNPYIGMSPMMAAARTVDTEVEAVTWNKVALQNRAVSDGMVSFAAPLSDSQYKKARLRVREQHMGSRNARVPWVMGNEARWVKMSETAVEMDFINSRKLLREEICAVFGVPPVLVGILDRATYANYETARRVFWQDTITPFLSNLADGLTLALARDFGGGIYVSFDTSGNEVLNTITKELVDTAAVLHSMGVPFNDINERLNLGLPDPPGGDIGYVSGNLTPVAVGSVDTFADDLDMASARLESVISKIGQMQASDDASQPVNGRLLPAPSD